MKNRPVAVLLLFSLAAAGCQGNPQVRRVVDSYNAEARQMEDMIYLLEQDIQVLEQENNQLKRQIERGGGATGAGSSGTRRSGIPPRREEDSDLTPPVVEGLPEVEPMIPPRPLNRPALPAEPDIGPVLDPPSRKPAAGPASRVKPTGHEQNVADAEAKEPEVADKNVTHIHLSGLHTCGMDLDHQPGDDGLSILIEPRNAANQFVPLAAPVSVVVLDPNKTGEDARLARWDFTAAEATEKLVKGDTRGIHLKLPWPAKPPASARLEVFVRYETPDGKKLQGEKEVFIALPGQFSQRWTPRPADRQRKSRSEPIVAAANEPRVAAVPPPLTAIEPPAEKPAAENTPPRLMPPAGLSERQAGEKPAKPKWSPTR
ncbi:MAG: hypothetical protein ACR2FY_10595 [Pirellulaceae bacterium]